jgi:flagellar hook-associated protein 3 FlgL
MSLRTPSTDYYRQSLLNLQNVQEQIAQNTQRLSSGKQITSPGDDPVGTATILDFQNSIQANTQFLAQATSANGLLQSAADALTGIIDAANNLQVLAQDALGSANTAPTGLANTAPQVDAIRTNLISMANTEFQGKYIFAGAQTTTQPFQTDSTHTDGLKYWGDSTTINLNVGAPTANGATTTQTTIATNIPGSTIFFGSGGQDSSTDIFQVVNDLYTALKNNDTAGVQTASTNLSSLMSNLYQQQAVVGGRQAGLNDLQTTISGINVSLKGLQSSIQSTDVPQTYTDLTSEQTAQQAIFSTIAKSNTNHLFNYLT